MMDIRRLEAWLWSERPPPSRARAAAFTVGRYAFALGRDLVAGNLSLHATSLVYTTMLATAPLLAFSFAILKGLGLHRQLRPLLDNLLAPLGPRGQQITDSVIGFVDNLSGSGLASISLVLLVLTALSVAQKVEVSLNYVWKVDRPRRFAQRFTEYLSVMLVGPVLMSVAFGVIAAVNSTALLSRLRASEPFGEWLAWIGGFMPYVLVTVGFGALYRFVPNTRVRTRPAVVGGLFGGLVWAAGGSVFTALVVNASRYDAIYSSFAIVIMTMLWLNLSWLILLLGAQLAFYVQNPESMRRGRRDVSMSNELKERLAMAVMLLAGSDFEQQRAGPDTESLASHIRAPRHLLEPVVALLLERRLLIETADGTLVPGKDLHAIELEEVLEAVRGVDGRAELDRDPGQAVDALAEQIEQAIKAALQHRTLADFIAESRAGASDSLAPRVSARRRS